MKYAQLIIGLLAGTALGGTVMATTQAPIGTGMDDEAVKKIVRQVISDEPKLIMESVEKYQVAQQKEQNSDASGMLKDVDVHKALYASADNASIGPKDSKRTIVEFFDYNCPVCKMQFKILSEMMQKDSSLHLVFIEYPIFGPVSDLNAKLGIAVWHLYPDKYYEFHEKMMSTPGHGPGNNEPTYQFIKDLGMDVDKVKAEADKKDMLDTIERNRALAEKLHIRGTPALVIGDDLIPHAADTDELQSRLNAIEKK